MYTISGLSIFDCLLGILQRLLCHSHCSPGFRNEGLLFISPNNNTIVGIQNILKSNCYMFQLVVVWFKKCIDAIGTDIHP